MSEYLDKTYIYIMKNFIRFGILLLIIGTLLMVSSLVLTENSTLSLKATVAGGFLFLSGTFFIIASAKPKS